MTPIVFLLLCTFGSVSAHKLLNVGPQDPTLGPKFDPELTGSINKEQFRTLLLATATIRANASPAGKLVMKERTAHQLAVKARYWDQTRLNRPEFDALYENEVLEPCEAIIPLYLRFGREVNEVVILRPELCMTNEGKLNRIAKLCSFLKLEETREDIFNLFRSELLLRGR